MIAEMLCCPFYLGVSSLYLAKHRYPRCTMTSHDLSTMNHEIFRRDEIWIVEKGNGRIYYSSTFPANICEQNLYNTSDEFIQSATLLLMQAVISADCLEIWSTNRAIRL